jgi:hypothetical protein
VHFHTCLQKFLFLLFFVSHLNQLTCSTGHAKEEDLILVGSGRNKGLTRGRTNRKNDLVCAKGKVHFDRTEMHRSLKSFDIQFYFTKQQPVLPLIEGKVRAWSSRGGGG